MLIPLGMIEAHIAKHTLMLLRAHPTLQTPTRIVLVSDTALPPMRMLGTLCLDGSRLNHTLRHLLRTLQ